SCSTFPSCPTSGARADTGSGPSKVNSASGAQRAVSSARRARGSGPRVAANGTIRPVSQPAPCNWRSRAACSVLSCPETMRIGPGQGQRERLGVRGQGTGLELQRVLPADPTAGLVRLQALRQGVLASELLAPSQLLILARCQADQLACEVDLVPATRLDSMKQ